MEGYKGLIFNAPASDAETPPVKFGEKLEDYIDRLLLDAGMKMQSSTGAFNGIEITVDPKSTREEVQAQFDKKYAEKYAAPGNTNESQTQ